jgi:hypothetical protein
MASTEVAIYVTTGEPRREWCDRCQTSARIDVTVYALLDDGPSPIGTGGGCTRCDPHLFREG